MAEAKIGILAQFRDEASAGLSRLGVELGDLGNSANFVSDGVTALSSALGSIGAGAAIASAVNAFADGEAKMNNFDALLSTLPPNLQALRGEILKVAEESTYLGFSQEDSALAMAELLRVLGNGPDTFKAFTAAQGVAILHNEDILSATREVIMGMRGMGKAFLEDGIVVDEHLTKQQNLANILSVASRALDNYKGSVNHAKAELTEFGNQAQQSLGGQFADAFVEATSMVEGFIRAHGGLGQILKDNDGILKIIAITLTTLVVAGFVVATAAALAMAGPFGIIIAVIAALVGVSIFLYTLWKTYWPDMKNLIITFWNAVKPVLEQIGSWVKSKVIDPLVDGFNTLISKLQAAWDWVTKLASKIGAGATGAYNSVKSMIGLATGGIVTAPTVAMVGESGPEAVIPLNRLNSMGGGGGITVNINGDVIASEDSALMYAAELARVIKNQINIAGVRA